MIGAYLPNLPGLYFLADDHGNGIRGWLRLAAVHESYGLEDLGNPYAAGLIDVPDAMGYALAAVTDDGDTLCEQCVMDPSNPVHPADSTSRDGWGIEGWTCSGELEAPDYCGHCGSEWTGHGGEVDA